MRALRPVRARGNGYATEHIRRTTKDEATRIIDEIFGRRRQEVGA